MDSTEPQSTRLEYHCPWDSLCQQAHVTRTVRLPHGEAMHKTWMYRTDGCCQSYDTLPSCQMIALHHLAWQLTSLGLVLNQAEAAECTAYLLPIGSSCLQAPTCTSSIMASSCSDCVYQCSHARPSNSLHYRPSAKAHCHMTMNKCPGTHQIHACEYPEPLTSDAVWYSHIASTQDCCIKHLIPEPA